MWFPNGLHLLFFNSLASIILSLFFIFFYKNSLKNNINENYFFKNILKITAIINCSVFLIVLLLIIIIGTFSDEKTFFTTILMLSLLTIGIFLFIVIGIDIILIYFLLFSIPLCISSFVLIIVQKNHLSKGKMIFYITLNAIVGILLFILINIIFEFGNDKILESIKDFFVIVIGVIQLFLNI
jgi:hypothetical protein